MLTKESTYSKLIHYFALVLFTGLFVVGFVISGYNGWVWSEFPELVKDNPFFIVVGLIAAWFVFKGLSAFYDRFLKNVNPAIITAVFCALAYGVSLLWVIISRAVPQADQLSLYSNAQDINNGSIEPMTESSYLVFFPYQLGFVSFLRVLIRIFGEDNYRGVQLVLALSSPIIVAAGSGIIKHILGEKAGKARFIYAVLMLLCLPMHFYTTFIYGDLPFAAMSLVCIWLMYECISVPKWWKFVLFFLSCGFNYLLKVNALIVFAAMGIFLVFHFIFHKEKRAGALILVVLMLVGAFGFSRANRALYSDVIPEGYDSPPFIATVVMGMNDDNSNAGWCNFYHQNTFVACDFNAAATKVQCRADLIATLKYWATHPLYTVDFLYRKINLQWNTPFYQALCMNSTHDPNGQPALGTLIYDNEKVHMGLQKFMKIFQLSSYGIVALALILSRKKERELKAYVPMIAVFGSFLFSLIWESKTRYQMPAFIMLIPCVAICVPYIQEWAAGLKKTGIREVLSSGNPAERRHYNGIDLFKPIMALFVIAIHIIPHIIYSPGRVYWGVEHLIQMAVPFFFLATGFLMAEKLKSLSGQEEKERAVKRYIGKTTLMYLGWTLIYLPFVFDEAIKNQFRISYALRRFFIQLFFRGDHAYSYVLWYLLSCIFGMLFVLLLLKLNVKDTTMAILCVAIFALTMYLNDISHLDEATGIEGVIGKVLEVTFGNGRVLTGLFYIPMGMLMSRNRIKIPYGVTTALCGYILLATGLFGNWGIALMAAGVFAVAKEISLPDSKAWLVLRRLSTGYYFIHLFVWYVLCMILYKRIEYGPVMYGITIAICTVLVLCFYAVNDCVIKRRRK